MGDEAARRRAWMVETQLRARGIGDERVLSAMGAIPRERFTPAPLRARAYDDEALGIDAGQSISQPYMVARMTELLAVQPGELVLEIGTGSGYQAAVLATLGARVTSLERHATLAEQARARLHALGLDGAVEIRVEDGSLGGGGANGEHGEHGAHGANGEDGANGEGGEDGTQHGAYDGIIVTAAAPSIPQALRDRLRDGGRLVIPVGGRDLQTLMLVNRRGNDWLETPHGACIFVPLIGPGGFPDDDAGHVPPDILARP